MEIRKIVKAVKEPKKNKYCAMKLSQIHRRIELCMREIILRFEMIKFILFLTELFIFVFLASTEVLSYWAEETLGD
jgi:hypothetical protein